MRNLAPIAALLCGLWSASGAAESGVGGFEAARKECGGLQTFDAIKECVGRVNGVSASSEPTLDLKVQAWMEGCQKSDSLSYVQDCVRKLVNVFQAQENSRLATAKAITECAGKADTELRGCIDEMATIVAIPREMASRPPVEATPPKKTGWYIAPQTESKIDGTRRVLLLLTADEAITTSAGREVEPSMAIRCGDNVTSVVVNAPGHFVTGGVAVTYRLDKDKPVTQTWTSSESRDSVGLWSGGQAIPFVKALLDRQELVLRYKPYRSSTIELSFTVAGLDKVIEPIRAACKW